MVKIADFIEAPNSGGDYCKVLLVVHLTISPETIGAARGVVRNWNATRKGSTQYVVDSREIIQAVRETAYAWAAGTTANKYGIHVEHCGYIQTIRQWRDGYSTAELELSAPLFAELGAKYGIPLRRLTVEQIRHAVKTGNPADGGICGHDDITKAFPGETTHTDPGASFPWDRFMGLVKAAAKTTPAPVKRATTTLRVVDWNVQRDRGPKTVLHELQHLAATADVMTLQEVAGYRALLDQIDGFHCASFADDTAVLVRDGREVKAACAVRVTSRGWFTVRGGQTGPKSVAACIVDGIGCASVHTPPTVQSKAKRLAAPRRWAAYRELMTSMPALVAHLGSRCVVAGDWNVDAGSDKGTLTGWPLKTFANLPQHLRRHVPKDGTHGKRVIDYVFARNVHVGAVRVVDGHFGSDHRPITFTVHA